MQPEYPNLIFAKDGEIYMMNGLRYLVIGGAYSVDKYYRLSRGWNWWPDEHPSPEIKAYDEGRAPHPVGTHGMIPLCNLWTLPAVVRRT